MADDTDKRHDGPGLGGKLLVGLLLSAFILGAPFLTYTCVVDQMEIRDAGTAYVEALQQGRVDDAYQMLAPETQQRVSRDAFETALDTPALKTSGEHTWVNSTTGSSGVGCLSGAIAVGGKDKSFDLYMWREGERWTVHTIAYDEWDHTDMPWRCNY